MEAVSNPTARSQRLSIWYTVRSDIARSVSESIVVWIGGCLFVEYLDKFICS